MVYVLITIAVIIGALMPVQAGINAELTRFLRHPYLAALISFAMGTITLSIIILVQGIPLNELKRIPSASPHLFLGGLMGAFITGQLVMSVFIDHYGWLGIPVTGLNTTKIIGVFLMFAGIYLVMRKTT